MISKFKSFEPQSIPDHVLKDLGLSPMVDILNIPSSYSQINYCLNNVNRYLEQNDGEHEFGWTLSVWGNLILKLTAHVVVRKSNGKLLCVTPSVFGKSKIKFIPDHRVESLVENNRLPVKHVALIKHPLVSTAIDVENEIEQLHMSGVGAMTPQQANEFDSRRFLAYKDLEPIAKQKTGKNDLCFCGSKKLRKKCCK